MNRRDFIRKTTLASLSILTGCSFNKLIAQKDNKPNIIFIFSDDHAFQAIGAYGGRLARLDPTPNIDCLAKEGMV